MMHPLVCEPARFFKGRPIVPGWKYNAVKPHLYLLFVILPALVSAMDASALTLSENGTVVDAQSGLMWQQDATEPMTLLDAVKYCRHIDLAGRQGWRLPYKEELLNLASIIGGKSAIEDPVFSVSPMQRYWTVSYLPDQPDRFWAINLATTEASDHDFIKDQCNARCVFEMPAAGYLVLLKRWSAAWSAQDIEAYLGIYGSDFVPETGDRSQWETQRRRKLTDPEFIKVTLSNIQLISEQGERVEVRFTQHYSSNRFRDKVDKILTLAVENGQLVIVRERAI